MTFRSRNWINKIWVFFFISPLHISVRCWVSRCNKQRVLLPKLAFRHEKEIILVLECLRENCRCSVVMRMQIDRYFHTFFLYSMCACVFFFDRLTHYSRRSAHRSELHTSHRVTIPWIADIPAHHNWNALPRTREDFSSCCLTLVCECTLYKLRPHTTPTTTTEWD